MSHLPFHLVAVKLLKSTASELGCLLEGSAYLRPDAY